MLKKMDTNKDGVITLDEFQPPARDRMAKADTNKDGAISLEEMNAGRSEKMAEHQAHMADRMAKMDERFSAMDTDKDGNVTRDEARQAIFIRMDTNQDGQLSADELRRPGGKQGHRRHMGQNEIDDNEADADLDD